MKWIGYLFLIIFTAILLFPLLIMITNSLQENVFILRMPPQLIPSRPTVKHYQTLFNYPILLWTLNTIIILVGGTIGMVFLVSMGAYAFAKKQFKGKTFIFWFLVASLIVPGMLTFVPAFTVIKKLRLLNTYWAIILPGWPSINWIFFLTRYLKSVPDEIFLVAEIDGANELHKFFYILLPLCTPALATMTLFGVTGGWSSLLWPMMVLTKEKMTTLAVGIARVITADAFGKAGQMPDFGLTLAGATYTFIPIFILFFVFQRHFQRGIFGGME